MLKRIFCILSVFALILCSNLPAYASVSSSIAQTEVEEETVDYSWAKSQVFEADISEIVKMLEEGSITSEELCKMYLERINKYDKQGVYLNSIISINKNAVAQAKQLDIERKAGILRGELHGIPILVKDNIDVSGFPTTLGKQTDTVCDTDASAVAFLVSQGAIILGKTNMSTGDIETRYTASKLIGETRNVYDIGYSAGGSSGGSCVAVSANFATAALATDTNFSLSYPAALNGVVAFRPTFGLIDYSGAAKVNASRDVIAPVTRSVSDSALLMDIMTDSISKKTYSSALDKNSLKGKTVLVVKELSGYTYNNPNEFKKTDKEITELFKTAKQNLENAGATVVEVSIPKLFTYYNTCRESLKGSDTAKQNLTNELKGLLEKNGASAFIFPVYLSSALPSGFDKYGDHLSQNLDYLNCSGYLPSLVGLPSVTLSMGNLDCGVGAAFEMVALQNEDASLLSLAYSYEQQFIERPIPKTVPNLYEGAQKPEEKPQKEPVTSKPTPAPTLKPVQNEANASPLWQKVTVAAIIVALLILCVWIMLFGMKKDRRKTTRNDRNF